MSVRPCVIRVAEMMWASHHCGVTDGVVSCMMCVTIDVGQVLLRDT